MAALVAVFGKIGLHNRSMPIHRHGDQIDHNGGVLILIVVFCQGSLKEIPAITTVTLLGEKISMVGGAGVALIALGAIFVTLG